MFARYQTRVHLLFSIADSACFFIWIIYLCDLHEKVIRQPFHTNKTKAMIIIIRVIKMNKSKSCRPKPDFIGYGYGISVSGALITFLS